jgi:hypothetical protein
MTMNIQPVTCFVCGHKTLEERCDWEICPVCGWEDDALVVDGKDTSSPANKGMNLSEAQANYILFGASAERRKERVRPPEEREPLDPAWKPLAEALAIVERRKQEAN